MNTITPLHTIHHSDAVLFGCTFAFAVVLPLRADGVLGAASWWAVFAPLWLLDALVLVGAAIGVARWRKHGGDRADRNDVVGMALCAAILALLTVTEALACARLEGAAIDWRAVFAPTYAATIVATCAVVAQMVLPRRNSSASFETFVALGFLPWLFVSLRLNETVTWTWQVVFVPVWLLYAIALPVTVSLVLRAAVRARSPFVDVHEKSLLAVTALDALVKTVPSLAFMVVLTMKLEGSTDVPWTTVFVPLQITLGLHMWAAVLRTGGNPHWFALGEWSYRADKLLPRVGTVSYLSLVSAVRDTDGPLPAGPETDVERGADGAVARTPIELPE
eukprot:Unigene14076_Nuclearia_a/m.42495 Unigene14076_Nuclearia_a/g.42495  ORF Unigene14076_Nuclearia_a/g.42495 Unigene14076_Nuclearia_a/m.42495 type:complete len:334 (+) Unigene14076_Nuclearia_a:2-1003(+)